jgi:hypothetical protein
MKASITCLSLAVTCALTTFHATTLAQDRTQFESATAKMCSNDQRQNPGNLQRTDAELAAYCACYASEMVRTVPTDILQSSKSAATPEQAETLRQLMVQAGQRCSAPSKSK